MPLRLLPPAAWPIRPASLNPRMDCGGHCCRVLTTAAMLAEISAAPARDRAAEARAFDLGRSICRQAHQIAAERRSAAVDRAKAAR